MEAVAMPTIKNANQNLPRSFDALVAQMPPQAIMDDMHYENTTEMIDRLMSAGKLSRGRNSTSKPWFSWSRLTRRSTRQSTLPTWVGSTPFGICWRTMT